MAEANKHLILHVIKSALISFIVFCSIYLSTIRLKIIITKTWVPLSEERAKVIQWVPKT